jgi:PST family polysaccharide transporter
MTESGSPNVVAAPTGAAPEPSSRKLDRSLASGIAWTAGMRSLTQGLQWAAALLVVRLLTPHDYGLVGMAMAFLGLTRLVSEFGLGASIVQHHHLTSSQIARLNTMSVLLALGFGALSVAGSGLIAAFFGESQVQQIIVVLSVTFVLGGLDVVPRSLLRRDLRFRQLALIQAAENLSYAVTSLTLAALGFGYWSLVYGAVTSTAVRMGVAIASSPHRFELPRGGLGSIATELWFGWHIMVSRLAIYVRKFADIAIVGRMLGVAPLGAYNVAWTQANIPVDRVTLLISEVTPSVFAAAKHDQAALRRYVRIITEGIAFLTFPATLGLALIADDFVLLIFGERWAATITPLRILALIGSLRSLTPILSQVLVATEQAKKNMQFTVLSAIVIPIFLLIGTRWGLTGVALGWLIGHPMVMLPVLLPHALRAIGMSAREYVGALRPAALACAVMVVAVVATRQLMPPDWALPVRFALEVGIGALVYGVGVWFTYRARLSMFFQLLRSARGRRPAAAPAE